MSDKLAAAKDLRWLANKLRGITELADALDRLGSLDQQEKEAKERLASLANSEQQIKDRFAQADAEYAGRRAASEEYEKNAKDHADRVISKANDEAEKIVNEAKGKASKVTEQAKTRETAINTEIDKANTELARIGSELKERKAALDTIDRRLAGLREKLAG